MSSSWSVGGMGADAPHRFSSAPQRGYILLNSPMTVEHVISHCCFPKSGVSLTEVERILTFVVADPFGSLVWIPDRDMPLEKTFCL